MDSVQNSENIINKSLLYAQYDEESVFNKVMFKSLCSKFHSSLGAQDTLNKFNNFKDINGSYFDIIILDNKFGLEICHTIMEINPSQRIIIKINLDNNENLSNFYVSGYDDFLYEPLSKLSIEKSIYTLTEQMEYNNIVTRTLNEKNKSLTNLVSNYEKKLLDSQEKLEQRNQFFASMSHEIRSPMNAIIGMSQVLLDDTTLNRNQLETVKVINNSSNMLLGIINDILDFSKMEAGKLDLEKTPFDLNVILSYLASMTSLKAKEQGINLTFEIDHNIGKTYLGDPQRISQVLLNLLGNALKFTQGGDITLSIKTIDTIDEKSIVEFKVEDTGIGMSPEQLKNLFKNYTQASADTSRKYGGTGLGLSISKQLVSMMGGTIWVESQEMIGTSFYVKLTLDTDLEKRNYRLPSKDIMQMNVLIIDSNVNSMHSLKNLIKYFRMPVEGATNIAFATMLMQQNRFNLLFIDKNLYHLFDFESYKLKNSANIILIEDWKHIVQSTDTFDNVIDEVINRPFNQQRIFEIISTLYNINGLPDTITQTDKYDKDGLKALGKHKILVAEDNIINQKVLSGLLSSTQIEIKFADDGQIALDMLDENSDIYELILMDINMPNLDGYMTTQIIRQNSLYDKLPIVGLSGNVTPEDITKTKDIGMQDYLVKPIDVKLLYETLIKYLKNSNV